MCTVCGCGEQDHTNQHDHSEHAHHDHTHDHEHVHASAHSHAHAVTQHTHHYGPGEAGVAIAGMSQERIIQIERDVLAKNDDYARQNRAYFEQHGILTLNLTSSPGSGKTTLLEHTLRDLHGEFGLAVIEGDQQTEHDAERIRATGVTAVQINTGKGCHLDAHQVGHAIGDLQLADYSVLFIENVGNLVCPAMFDLGEAAKVVILSVTEGEDKPIKYPDMFHRASLVLLNKIDLLPYVNFDVGRCLDYLQQVNANAPVIQLSATTGEGMGGWYTWLREHRNVLINARVQRLENELAALKKQLA